MENFWSELRNNPFGVLGIQPYKDHYVLRVLNNHAQSISAYDSSSDEEYPLIKNEQGFFEVYLSSPIQYSLNIKYNDIEMNELDPYSFPPMLSDYDLYLFNEGTHRYIWDIMGSHVLSFNQIDGILFSVWAPNALSVRLIGDFNGWDQERHFMRPRGISGVWEIFIPFISEGTVYKYAIETKNGIVHKADPYAFFNENSSNKASIVFDLENKFEWDDELWMEYRSNCHNSPLSIYEFHLSSWIKSNEYDVINYRDIVLPLTEYVLQQGFTHVELMPITEYPYDASWGYQVTGYYSPTSRYGTPDDFMFFVNYLHQHGIGVILDWVPAHFPCDDHGLFKFDGTSLYEHEDPRLGWHHDWNTAIFNYGRNEIKQFLIGSALFWLKYFHIDGLRVDAVASMLYLDYSRKDGEWIPNKHGGRENLEAIAFLRLLNDEIKYWFPSAMTIAEESTSFPGVTSSTENHGLGFSYKWNMGWMHDTLKYFSVDPLFRSYHHYQIMFSLVYAFTENFILPFSHDEVVHGKGTLLSRMPGTEWEKFANLRLMYAYMWAHPGKKLLFHGQEWGSWEEWSEQKSIDWNLNNYALHHGMRILIRDLNSIYKLHRPLFEIDHSSNTFSWIDCHNTQSGLLMWVRWDRMGQGIFVVLNLNSVVKLNYRVGVPISGEYMEIFNSDHTCYGGAGISNETYIRSEQFATNYQEQSISINIGPLSALMFSINKD